MAPEYMSRIWKKIVSFDDAQTVLRMQQENIELAHEHQLDPRHIATLERNHERYRYALELRKDGDSFPTPWDPRLSEEQQNDIPDLGEWRYVPRYQTQLREGSPESPFDWDPPKVAYFYNDSIAAPSCTKCHRVLKILQARNIDLNAVYDARVHWSWTMARSNCLPRRLNMRVAGPWVTYTQFHFDVAIRVFKQDGRLPNHAMILGSLLNVTRHHRPTRLCTSTGRHFDGRSSLYERLVSLIRSLHERAHSVQESPGKVDPQSSARRAAYGGNWHQ